MQLFIYFERDFSLLRKFKNRTPNADKTATVTPNKANTAKLYPWVKGDEGSPKQTAQNTIL
jgi:hypothetical protein